MAKRVRPVLFVFFAAIFGATPSLEAQDSWQFRVTPYLWTMAVAGQTDLGGIPITVDAGIRDLISQLDMALQFNIEARKGNFLVLGDSHYASLTKNLDLPPGQFHTRQAIALVAAGYRFDERYDVYGGVRYYNVRSRSDFNNFPNLFIFTNFFICLHIINKIAYTLSIGFHKLYMKWEIYQRIR